MSATQPRALWNVQAVMLDHLPDSSTIKDIQLVKGLNATKDGKLTEEAFRRLLASAKPVDAKQLADRHWAYAPWYSGTFTTPEGLYNFELYLGGRGKLLGPDGRAGLFSFDQTSG